MKDKLKNWNGPPREFSSSGRYKEEMCYCVKCGNIYVWTNGRNCPTCTAYHACIELEKKIDQLCEVFD